MPVEDSEAREGIAVYGIFTSLVPTSQSPYIDGTKYHMLDIDDLDNDGVRVVKLEVFGKKQIFFKSQCLARLTPLSKKITSSFIDGKAISLKHSGREVGEFLVYYTG